MDTLPFEAAGLSAGHDREMDAVVGALLGADPDGSRFARSFRRTMDMLLDGQNTGRFRWDQLHKTEKTHAGTLVEINLQREFNFADGDKMDYRIAGTDVDCKFSQDLGRWMIPPEAVGHLCLVTWCNDAKGQWSAGLVRVREHELSAGVNRDSKRYLTAAGRSSVRWLFHQARLPDNALLRLPPNDIDAIFTPKSGQQRINELFRRTLGRPLTRTVIATVAQQRDYMKRVRSDGGARTALAPEGIVILGQYSWDVDIAAALGLPLPQRGDSMSVRIAPWVSTDGNVPRVEIANSWWRQAREEDPICMAPKLPEKRKPTR